MSIKDFCTPGLMIPQLFPNARKQKGVYISVMRSAAELNFYEAFEIAETPDYLERKEINSFIKGMGFKLVYWLSFIQYDTGLSISALDENERKKAIGKLLIQIPYVFECGADYIGFLSGPDVNVERREDAKKQLAKSICEMSQKSKEFGTIKFLLESLDREAHKKHIIGPTKEAIEFIFNMREAVPELYLNYDIAHIKLLKENPIESLSMAKDVIAEIHLTNCVDDLSSPQFGDNHMPFGEPGFLTTVYIADLFKKGLDIGLLGPQKPIVSAEICCRVDEDPWITERNAREGMIEGERFILNSFAKV